MRKNMRKNMRKIILALLFTIFFMIPSLKTEAAAGSFTTEDEEIVICIDPGHGGENKGAEYLQNDILTYEKELDLKIGLYLKENLEQYENVRVEITRTEDIDVSIDARAEYAKNVGADYFISVHNNATEEAITDKNGCMVLMTVGGYQPENTRVPSIENTSLYLCNSVIRELTGLGITISTDFDVDKTAGILRRPYSPEGLAKTTKYYPNDSVTDYYGAIKGNIERGIPAIIIEHAYGNNASDFEKYLSSDEKLKVLADADERAIASALHLKHK